ncbi:MAG: FAD-dependent oxidoreductase [Planctomycetota bacterium]
MIDRFALPEHLAERVRVLRDGEPRAGGAFVLCWMHHALRAHENPMLDVAAWVANSLELPVLVYQGLGGHHRFNSDRHHTFVLEGAADLAPALAQRPGEPLAYAFSVPRESGEASPLRELSERAAVIVCEDFPAPPMPRWTNRLAERASCPVLAIDACCIVPMQTFKKAPDRAFKFRSSAAKLFYPRAQRPWEDVPANTAAPKPEVLDLPFEPVDFERASIDELCAGCEIDHTIGPVRHTRGGSTEGYARWTRFRDDGLAAYAKRRNNAAIDGVSRLSPYLHYGMISPHRLVRETMNIRNEGSEKFIDELFVWRELAHHWCFHRSLEDDSDAALQSSAALPAWAVKTLRAHADDAREPSLVWEQLARARSGDELWDAAQRSLLRQGELHNNVRMTWGKAVASWTPGPGAALAWLIDLNHRYALDGSDANSYGGLLWCLGLFDRPFEPEREVLGTIRPRETAEHAQRLDLAKYRHRFDVPGAGGPVRIGVIGAGMSGLIAARTLADQGHDVVVFEKSRGPGGRMSTRRVDADGLPCRFDHGAQYFTVRDERFARFVDSWERIGVVEPWDGRVVAIDPDGLRHDKSASARRLVGVPGMNAVLKHLAADLELRLRTRVGPLRREGNHWLFVDEDGEELGRFDAAVVSAPMPQTVELIQEVCPGLAERAGAAEIAPCWAAMIAFDEPVDIDFDAAFVNGAAGGALSWVACDTSKPGRDDAPGSRWVLHGGPDWSIEHLEDPADTVLDTLLGEFGTLVEGSLPSHAFASAHRWRYALPTRPIEDRCLWDARHRLAVCGDWCAGPRVEGAFLSGSAAAGRILSIRVEPSGDAEAESTLFAETSP